MKKVNLTAVIRREGNIYVALCPETGTASQGDSILEALNNLKEATELHLEDNADEVEWFENEQPFVTTFEVRIGRTEPSIR